MNTPANSHGPQFHTQNNNNKYTASMAIANTIHIANVPWMMEMYKYRTSVLLTIYIYVLQCESKVYSFTATTNTTNKRCEWETGEEAHILERHINLILNQLKNDFSARRRVLCACMWLCVCDTLRALWREITINIMSILRSPCSHWWWLFCFPSSLHPPLEEYKRKSTRHIYHYGSRVSFTPFFFYCSPCAHCNCEATSTV